MESDSRNEIEKSIQEELKQLGLWDSSFEDESDAPAVDESAVQTLAHGEMSEAKKRLLLSLIARYRSWFDAYVDALSQPGDQATNHC